MTEAQPSQEDRQRYLCSQGSQYNGQTYYTVCENERIMQWVRNGHIVVKGHCQYDSQLKILESVNKKHLGEASREAELSSIQREDPQHFGESEEGQTQIRGS